MWVVSWWSIEAMMVVEASENSGRTLRKLSLPILSVRDARSPVLLAWQAIVSRLSGVCQGGRPTGEPGKTFGGESESER